MTTVVTGIRLIDGTGRPALEAATVAIDGPRILAAGPAASIPSVGEAEVWDLAGLTLLPGLIDAHVHLLHAADLGGSPASPPSDALLALRSIQNARATLEAGFTTVCDLMSPNDAIFSFRQAAAEGRFPSPRVLAAGRCLTITGGHGTQFGLASAWEVDGPEAFRQACRMQMKHKADLIKVMGTRPALTPPYRGGPSFAVDEMLPGIADAHAAGYVVAAHAHTSVAGIRYCVEAGVDRIEHGDPADDATLEMMAERGTILVPTLAVNEGVVTASRQPGFPFGEPVRRSALRKHELALDTTRRAHSRGVRIALGTDAGFTGVPHGSNAHELELLVEAGLSPMEALVAGTGMAALACGRAADLGTIEPGKSADLIAVDGDPLRDVSLLCDPGRIKLVIQNGQIVVDRRLTPPGSPTV